MATQRPQNCRKKYYGSSHQHLTIIPRKLIHTNQMLSKGQSPPDQSESNYFQLSLVCLKFMLFLAKKIAGVIPHPLWRLRVWAGATPANKGHGPAQQPVLNQAACKSLRRGQGGRAKKPTARSWNALKIIIKVTSAVTLGRFWDLPAPQPGGWSISWLPSSDHWLQGVGQGKTPIYFHAFGNF